MDQTGAPARFACCVPADAWNMLGMTPGSSNVDPSDQVLSVVSVAPAAIERPERARPRAALIETVSASRRYGFSTSSKPSSTTCRAYRLYPVARRTGSSGLRSRRVEISGERLDRSEVL
jgi:hypothetical protein